MITETERIPGTALAMPDVGFSPSEDQLLYAEFVTSLDCPTSGGLRAICGAIGLSEVDVVGWFQNEGFRGWLDAYQAAWFHTQLPMIHMSLIRAALSGKVAAAKTFMERFDDDYILRIGKGKNLTADTGYSEDTMIRMIADKCGSSVPMVMQLLGGRATIALNEGG